MTATMSRSRIGDALKVERRSLRALEEGVGIWGTMRAVLLGPDGRVKAVRVARNLINDKGDEFYAKKVAGVAVNAVVGMKIGTQASPASPSKNGANSTLQTYTTGITANRAIDGGFPTAATKGAGSGWRVTWQATWAAGQATNSNLSEIIITNQTTLDDVAPAQADTLSRALLSPVINKGASDTLIVTWQWDDLGA
jgi:hypothetical protein